MKKILFLTFLASSFFCFSQSYDLQSIQEVKFFGVDFSQVKVYGAQESPEQFQAAFERINQLFITEYKKYDPSTFLRKKVYGISVEEVEEQIKNMDISNLMTSDKRLTLSREDLQRSVSSLKIAAEEGVGVVFVADLLNKVDDMGYYFIVFFDMNDKQIIDTWEGKGKPGGFGLRNFWAGSISKMLKSGRISYN